MIDEKLAPLIIWKSKKPRCCKGIDALTSQMGRNILPLVDNASVNIFDADKSIDATRLRQGGTVSS